MGRTIALVGMGPTREDALRLKEARPEVEVWTLNRAVYEEIIAPDMIDRLYEIHPAWYVIGPWYPWGEEYGDWLAKEQPFPIQVMMQQEAEIIPSGIVYPIKGVLEACFSNSRRGRKRVRFLTTSFSFMAGHLIYEHKVLGMTVDRCEMYGFDMEADFEWAYQKPGAHRLVGHMEGLGIETWTPFDCTNFDAKLYGYEVSEMIPRQTFEEWRLHYIKRVEEFKARLNKTEEAGVHMRMELQAMRMAQAPPDVYEAQEEKVQEQAQEWLDLRIKLARYETGAQLCSKYIQMCDLQEPDPDFIDMVGRLPFTGYEEYTQEPEEESELVKEV